MQMYYIGDLHDPCVRMRVIVCARARKITANYALHAYMHARRVPRCNVERKINIIVSSDYSPNILSARPIAE